MDTEKAFLSGFAYGLAAACIAGFLLWVVFFN